MILVTLDSRSISREEVSDTEDTLSLIILVVLDSSSVEEKEHLLSCFEPKVDTWQLLCVFEWALVFRNLVKNSQGIIKS